MGGLRGYDSAERGWNRCLRPRARFQSQDVLRPGAPAGVVAVRHREKFAEAAFNLDKLQESFRLANGEAQHHLNNFLSSVQAVLWCLNKEFSGCEGYQEWATNRSDRLPPDARTFKELRNISLKEGPVKNLGVVLGFDFGAAGIVIPAHATVEFPWIETATGRPVSYKAIIKTLDGEETEVQPVVLHDFTVTVESDGKLYHLSAVIAEAHSYLAALEGECAEAERRWLAQ